MSHITVHRRGKLRTGEIGRVAQILALPPQPARHQGDHWDFTRRGFAHGFFPGRYDERTGKTDPIVAAAREAALAAGVDPTLVDDIDINDLIVTPEFLSGNVGGISFRVSTQMRLARTGTLIAAAYEPTGDYDVVSLANAVDWTDMSRSFFTAAVAAPIYVREISWTGEIHGQAERISLSCTQVGRIWEKTGTVPDDGRLSGHVTPNKLVTSGSVQLEITMENVTPAQAITDSLSALLVYEHARRK